MSEPQPGILGEPPPLARSLTFSLRTAGGVAAALMEYVRAIPPDWATLGLGEPVTLLCAGRIAGLRTFPGLSGAATASPSTQGALWVLLRGNDPTETFKREAKVRDALAGAFELEDAASLFGFDGGRDLSGFQDGTANPKGAAADAAAIVRGRGALDGSSFVAVQRWVHDLHRMAALSREAADAVVGRRLDTNELVVDAPASAHVKRTFQESFDPPAFLVRRSMPFSDREERGLEFIAYATSLDPFERQLRRMHGLDDGIVDGLFVFSRPVRGSYYWCPPLRSGKIDLSALGIG